MAVRSLVALSVAIIAGGETFYTETTEKLSASEWTWNAVWIAVSVVGGLMGLLLAVERTSTATRQAETALDQLKTSERGERNGRYQKGAEMLGSEQMAIRLAGIYSLKNVALEDPENYLEQITELLSAYVRHPTEVKGEKSAPEGEDSSSENPRSARMLKPFST